MPAKKRRRPRGEGSIYQRKSTGIWYGAVWYEDEYGEEHRAAVARADKGDLMEAFRNLKIEIAKGDYRPRSKMTVEAWFTYWVEEIVKPNKAPKTYKSYKDTTNNQIIPFVGDKQLPITPAILRGNLKKVGEKWSPRMAELTYAVWSVSMKAAKKEGVIKTDPTEAVKKPMNNKSVGQSRTTEQARTVLRTALAHNDRMVTRWAMAFMLGARQGECLGLEIDRVNMETLAVDTSWQLQSLQTKPGSKLDDPDRFVAPDGYELRPLYRRFALTRRKGQRPVMIPLPEPLAAIFEVYLESAPPNEFGLMWVSPAGNPIDNKTDSEAWHAALALAGVPDMRLHDARHTTATLLLEMGVEESVRMAIMGQSSLATQRRYAHVDLSLARKALGNLDGLLELG